MTIIVTCFCIEYRENKDVSDFSTISVSIIDYVYLILNNYVEHIKSFIQFHFVRNFVRKLFYNMIVRQQYAINIIVNIIYKNFFFNTCLIFLLIDYKSFDDNKVFDVNAFNVR